MEKIKYILSDKEDQSRKVSCYELIGSIQSDLAPRVQIELTMAGPSHAIGLMTRIHVGGDLKRFQVDDHDVIVWSAGNEGARAVRLHLNSGSAVAYRDVFCFAARGGVEDDDVGTAQR